MPATRRSPRQKAQGASAQEARTRAALAWPSEPETAPLTPDECRALLDAVPGHPISPLETAWSFNTAYDGEVLLGCFSRTHHSKRSHTEITTQTQGGPWYRSRREAALALHWAIARECAARLVRVEDRVAGLLATPE